MAQSKERPAVDRKARLKIPPQKIPKQEPNTRVLNWGEAYLPLSLDIARIEAERCIQCPAAPCQVACPVDNDIPRALWALEQGDPDAASDIFHETSNMPEMCGRLCPQERLCEGHCVVAKTAKPVAIGRLEAFVADWQRAKETARHQPARQTGRRVAVVGAGPAGLAVAEELASRGHAVTVYDAWPEPGGVLRYGIPQFKLEKRVLDEWLERLEPLPITFELNTRICDESERSLGDLLGAFDLVFVAHGASAGNPLEIEGGDLAGIHQATEFLSRANLTPSELPPSMREPLHAGRRVIIIGGGDTSMDCARTAIRLGAREVTLVYRRTEREMVGREEERQHAREEGVRFEFLAAPARFLGTPAGRVRAAQLVRMELGPPDDSGRRRPQAVAGSEFTIEADTIVLAIGYSVDDDVTAEAQIELDNWGNLIVDRATGRTNHPRVFAGGDNVNGADLVVTALRDARIAARTMHEDLCAVEPARAAS